MISTSSSSYTSRPIFERRRTRGSGTPSCSFNNNNNNNCFCYSTTDDYHRTTTTVVNNNRRRRRVNALEQENQLHKAEILLDESRALYEQGERMQGYKKLEQAMRIDDDASLQVRREIRYQAMCCVAAFGDVEMAKQYLREMEILGLPYDIAVNDKSLMRMESSALMRNQLKKFASGAEKSFGTVQREVYERTKKTLPGGPGGNAPIVNKGLMELEIADNTDASVGGIAKRVGGVVLASIFGFGFLFFAGLKLIQESGY